MAMDTLILVRDHIQGLEVDGEGNAEIDYIVVSEMLELGYSVAKRVYREHANRLGYKITGNTIHVAGRVLPKRPDLIEDKMERSYLDRQDALRAALESS